MRIIRVWFVFGSPDSPPIWSGLAGATWPSRSPSRAPSSWSFPRASVTSGTTGRDPVALSNDESSGVCCDRFGLESPPLGC